MIFCSTSNLIQGYAGQTERAVKKIFDEGRGCLIVFDEADYLLDDDPSGAISYKRDAFDKIVGHLAEEKEHGTVVILTGYEDKINALMNQNEGMGRRCTIRLSLEAYNVPTLRKIFEGNVAIRGYTASPGVVDKAFVQICAAKEFLGVRFGNAGAVETFINIMIGARASEIGAEELLRMIQKGVVCSEEDKRKMREFQESDVPVFDPATGTFKLSGSVRPSDIMRAKAERDQHYG